MADDRLTAVLEDLDSRHFEIPLTSGDRVCAADHHAWPCHAHRALAVVRLLLGWRPVITSKEYDQLVAILTGKEGGDEH